METPLIPSFNTERLHLRPLTISDIPAYEKHFIDYEVIRYLSSAVPWPYPAGGVEWFLKNLIIPNQGKDRWAWAINLRERPTELIGVIDLFRKGQPENRGFWLGRAFWGKGYMTEAIAPINQFAFETLGFDRLLFSNAVGNTRSRRIKEKTGARFVGYREAQFVDPAFKQAETWELTREAYFNSK